MKTISLFKIFTLQFKTIIIRLKLINCKSPWWNCFKYFNVSICLFKFNYRQCPMFNNNKKKGLYIRIVYTSDIRIFFQE